MSTAPGPLARICMSLPEELLICLDRLVKRRGFSSRSHAMAVMLNRYLGEHRTVVGDEPIVGTITLLYRNEPQVQRQLAGVQQKFRAEIISCSFVPLVEEQTMAVLFVQGAASKLKVIGEELVALRGVSYSNTQLVFSATAPPDTAQTAAAPLATVRHDLRRPQGSEPRSRPRGLVEVNSQVPLTAAR